MAVTILKRVEEEPTHAIAEALSQLVAGRKGTLMLIHVSTGSGYQVISHDPEAGKTKLLGPTGAKLCVHLSEREESLYSVFWR